MVTVDQLRERRDVLTAARATGTLSVRFADGSQVQYRSDAELAAQIAFIDRELAAAAGVARPSRFYFNTSKGL